MSFRLIIIIIIIGIFSTGCATTQSNSFLLNQLQTRIIHLEQTLADRDSKIEELEYNLDELSSRVDDLEKFQTDDDMDELGDISSSVGDVSSSNLSKYKVIRVSVGAKDVQKALKKAGYYNGAIDGKIGKKTKAAIRAFQKDNGLEVDGIVGPRTWAQMKQHLE